MTNSVISRVGQINGSGATDAMFLEQFGLEVLTEFERNTVFKDRHTIRQISNGFTAQFPLIGRASAGYHTPGNFIDGGQIGHAEIMLTVDDLLQANVTIASIDEARNHYDVRAPYAKELGNILAQTYDINVARTAILAARASSPLTGRAGGGTITTTNMNTDGAVLEAAVWTAAQTLDEKFVPEQGRYLFLRPAQYHLLAQRERLVNSFLGGSGSLSSGVIPLVAGIDLVKTNNLPSANVATGPSKYQGLFNTTVGLIMNERAVGTVQLMDMAMESEYEIRRQATFMVAKYAVGHGILSADCAVELRSGTPS